MKQQAELGSEFYSLAEYVESLPVGTIFIDLDDLGRKTEMMRVFSGRCLTNNGDWSQRPFLYGDRWDDGYSVTVTHIPVEKEKQ